MGFQLARLAKPVKLENGAKRFSVVAVQCGAGPRFEDITLLGPVSVIAKRAEDALELVAQEAAELVMTDGVSWSPITVQTIGVRGGIREKFVGYESIVWRNIVANRDKL